MEVPKNCDQLMRERVNYFTGRHLAARDFNDEQSYHRSHRYLHNRMLHGWGVLCGLEVTQHDQDDCRQKYVRIGSGLAIDCCGREIVVGRAACCGDEQPEIPWDKYDPAHPWLLLCLSYDECGIDAVPVIYGEGDCSTEKTQQKYGRYTEGWKLEWHWVAKSQLPKYGWGRVYEDCVPKDIQSPPAQPGTHPPPHHPPEHPQVHPSEYLPDDCVEPCEEGYVSCLDLKCPPGHCVPLAIICAHPNEPITNDRIYMRGRPRLPYGAQRLTHIVDINWPHGKVITPLWLENNPLRVTFDRRLQAAPLRYYPGPWGVNQATFVVQFGEQYEDLDFAPPTETPKLTADGLHAEYKVAPRPGSYGGYDYLQGHILWITLKCDFLYDCHGRRVDGNNNGVEGGVFESWVTVVHAYQYEELERKGLL